MKENQKNRIRIIPRFISHDFWRKLLALAFAILVWERVSARLDDTQKIRGIPVKISMPEEYVLMDNAPNRIDIILKGPKQRLNKITPNDIQVTVDAKTPTIGENELIITTDNITLPKGVSVSSIEPDYFKVQIDEKKSKKVPVKLTFSGALMDGYDFNQLNLIPQDVTISGPRSIVDQITDIRTKNILLGKDYVDDFDCTVEVDNKFTNISVNPRFISARIEVYNKYDTRKLQNLPIKPFSYLPDGHKLEIKPATATVVVEGMKNAVETLTDDKIRPFIDLSEIDEPGDYTLNVQCWINDKDLSVKEILPITVNVRVSRQ